jgi:acyl carrier protein
MKISSDAILALLGRVLKRAVAATPDVPIIEVGPDFDSLAMVVFFAELEKLSGVELPESDAFELMGATANQIAARLSDLSEQRPGSAA